MRLIPVLDGVFVRSSRYQVIAVRKASGKILLRSRSHSSLETRFPLLRLPLVRGVVVFLESMIEGIEALGVSHQIQSEEPGSQGSVGQFAAAVIGAFAVGFLLFVMVPSAVSALLTSMGIEEFDRESTGFLFVEAVLKIIVLLAYLSFIPFIKDIRVLYSDLAAGNSALATIAADQDLTVENARNAGGYPGCIVTFLLALVFVTIVGFTGLFSVLPLPVLGGNPVWALSFQVFVKLVCVLPFAAILYEYQRASLKTSSFAMPLMVLQKLVSREPTDAQREVAIAALRQAGRLEQGIPSPVAQSKISTEGDVGLPDSGGEEEFEITDVGELDEVKATRRD